MSQIESRGLSKVIDTSILIFKNHSFERTSCPFLPLQSSSVQFLIQILRCVLEREDSN